MDPVAAPGGRSSRRGLVGLVGTMVLILLVVELVVWRQTRPRDPAGAVPVAGTQQLADQHGCRVPELWGVARAAGALVVSVDPGHPPEVAWVAAGQAGRWQPRWQVRQWCAR